MPKPDPRSREALAWRAWYNQARWKGPHGRRAQQLKTEPLCRMCQAAGRITVATVADHVIPHKGDEHLFWHGELQSLCDADPWRCHSSRKQRSERRGYEPGCDAKGRPTSADHPWNRAKAPPGG